MRSYEHFEPIHSLEWAKRTEAPHFPNSKKPNAAQRKGLAFEEKCFLDLKRILPLQFQILHGPWIEYKDKLEPISKVCQPDFAVIPEDEKEAGIILEAKHTFRPMAFEKLLHLYLPLAREIWQREFKVIQICKRLGKYKGPTYQLNQLLEAPDGAVIHHRL